MQNIRMVSDFIQLYKELLIFNNKKISNPITKWVNKLSTYLTNNKQMANKQMKRCSTSHLIKEMQIKTTTITYLLEWLKSKVLATPNAGEDVGK